MCGRDVRKLGVALAVGLASAAALNAQTQTAVHVTADGITQPETHVGNVLQAPPEKALSYQVAMSVPILGLAAWLSGETISRVPGQLTLILMAWQAIWVVGLTFLLWFGLIRTYSASKLSAFTFITPLFGVAAGYFIMHDPLTPAFGAAALLVVAGLYLVNRPGPAVIDPLLTVTKT